MAATAALCEALNQGISSGKLIDTKVISYSHRDSSGRVCRPKPLYANSHVLRTVPYFNVSPPPHSAPLGESHNVVFEVLFGNFAESQSEDDEDEKVASLKNRTKPTVHPFDPFAVPGEDSKILF